MAPDLLPCTSFILSPEAATPKKLRTQTSRLYSIEMTEDPNLIFTLRAISDYAKAVFPNPHNERYYVPPHPLVIAAASRESSVATNIGDEDGKGDGDGPETRNAEGKGDHRERFGHQLRFTFDQKPKNIERGFVFGSNPKTCDVLIGNSHDGISSSHFRITFDGQARLVLIDSSANGTAVSYGGQAREEKRKNPQDRKRNPPRDKSNDFMWILFPKIENKSVVIEGAKRPGSSKAPIIEFSVEVTDPKTDSCAEQYRELRDAYLEEARTAIPFGLNIDSHLTTAGQTESHSPTQRPTQRPIWINLDEIGKGEFGTVYRTIDVSTGVIYAAKMFLRKGKDHRERWDREVALLRQVSHNHIIKFKDHDAERKWPRLIMEYLPLGNLAEQNVISRVTQWETITVLYQGLDALAYLHSRTIVHRDLKPENILVQYREPANFCIKIADFGLAKDGSNLKTWCGTYLYAAPEIWGGRPYTAKVDIWSLGVIGFQYAYDLPEIPKVCSQFDPKHWYQRLARLIEDWDSDGLLDFLSSSMLKEDPLERLSASECLRRSTKLLEAIVPARNSDIDPGTPTEKMSSSTVMEAFQAITHVGNSEMVGKEGASFSFPTLSTLKSVRQLDGHFDLSNATCKSEEYERSQQEAEIGTGNGLDIRHSKRQCINRSGIERPSGSQQVPWELKENQFFIKMVVYGKAVWMRKLDFSLNATQITALAGKTDGERRHLLHILKEHTKVEVEWDIVAQSWIPYQDGRFLCEFLHLTDTLQPLFEYASRQGAKVDDRKTYFPEAGFLQVKDGDSTIFIRRKDFWINATHILKAAGHGRNEVLKLRRKGTGYEIVQKGSIKKSQGTYVDPLTGLDLCREYGLNSLESIFRETLKKYGCHLVAATPRRTIVEPDIAESAHSTNPALKTGSPIQLLPQSKTASKLYIDGTAKLSNISFFPERTSESFLPQMKGSF